MTVRPQGATPRPHLPAARFGNTHAASRAIVNSTPPRAIVNLTPPRAMRTESPAEEAARANATTTQLQGIVNAIARAATPIPLLHASADPAAIVVAARDHYDSLLRPPDNVVRRATSIIAFKRTLGSPDSVVYIFKRRRFLGMTYCTGWSIVAHPLGGGPPQTGSYFGSCHGDSAPAAWADALPTLPPRP